MFNWFRNRGKKKVGKQAKLNHNSSDSSATNFAIWTTGLDEEDKKHLPDHSSPSKSDRYHDSPLSTFDSGGSDGGGGGGDGLQID